MEFARLPTLPDSPEFPEIKPILPAVDFTKSWGSSNLELGILRSAYYSAGLGLVLSPKTSLKLGRVL